MRQGFYGKLLFSKSGNLVAIATGSDATAEHECGAKPLLGALTSSVDASDATVRALKASGIAKLVQKLAPVTYPSLLECKRITKLPPELRFFERDTEQGREAWLGFCRSEFPCYERELPLGRSAGGADPNVAGAWDQYSFAVRVRGDKYVKALRGFFQAIQTGHVAFASSFLRDEARMSGVVLADTRFISDAERAAIRTAQANYESDLRLRARDDSQALMQELHKLSGERHIGYLWAMWQDKEESEVVYGLNPGYLVKANYRGPYRRQQLLDWARAKCAYQLTSSAGTETV